MWHGAQIADRSWRTVTGQIVSSDRTEVRRDDPPVQKA
jgi:hypothetical protein